MAYNPNNPNGQATKANSAPITIASDQPALPISAASLPLPTGASTEATLSALNTKVPAQGQALAAASLPVVLTAAQVTTLTPPAAITGFSTEATLSALNAKVTTTVNGVKVDGSAVTQPVSGTIAVSNFPASQAVTGPLTDTQIRATALPVSGTFFQATQPVSAASLPLPSGASTETTLAALNTKVPAQGQALAAASLPVVLTAAQITTLTPPAAITGFSTETTLSALNTKVTTTANGVKVDGSAVIQPVSGAFFQATQPVSAASLPLPTGAATDTSLTNVQGPVAAGTAALKSSLMGGVFNTVLPTLTTGQQVSIQLDSSGRQIMVAPGIPNSLGQLPAAQSQPVTLSNENVQDMYVIGQAAQTALVNNILTVAAGAAATDGTGYRSFSVQVVSTGTAGTFIFEGCNDNVNFQTIPVYGQLIATGTPITAAITATATQLIYTGPQTTRYIRLRIATAITGGSIQAFTKMSQTPWSPAFFQATQATASNLQTTATIASGTITTLQNGQTAHSTASTGSPVRAGGRVITTLDTTLVQGVASDLAVTTGQQLLIKDFSTAENDWRASSGITALATTTSTALKVAGAASIRNYITGLQLYNTSATVSTTVSILDGATVIWTGYVPATTAALPVVDIHVVFPTPLRGTAATAMNIQCGTTGANLFYNVQGYQSF